MASLPLNKKPLFIKIWCDSSKTTYPTKPVGLAKLLNGSRALIYFAPLDGRAKNCTPDVIDIYGAGKLVYVLSPPPRGMISMASLPKI